MKQVLITVLFLSVIHCGWSQMEMKLKPRFSFGEKDSLTQQQPLFPVSSSSRMLQLDSSRFSHSSAAGSVYVLPQDNMPWLKPDTTLVYNMPVQNAAGSCNMPNAYPTRKNGLIILKRKP